MKKFFILLLLFGSCKKDDITPKKQCYDCVVIVNGIRKGIDKCVEPGEKLDFTNDMGTQLPWRCTLKP